MSAKKFFDWVHRWFGLIAGFYFVLLGLSGSYLVYEDDLLDIYDSKIRISNAPIEVPAIAASVQATRDYLKDPAALPSRITVPERANSNVVFRFERKENGEKKQLTLFVDPSTGSVAGEDYYRETISGKIFVFHHDLFWGGTGRTIMGVSGVLMLILLVTGLYLWWPKSGRWKNAFKFGMMKNLFQWSFELHRILGFYSFILMILVTFTGVFISKPNWFISASRPPENSQDVQSIQFDFAKIEEKIREQEIPGRGLSFRLDSKTGRVGVATTGEGHLALKSDGSISSDPDAKPNPVRQWNRDVHGGAFWGELGRFLIFISGILPLGFYISGFYMWRKKTGVRKERSRQ